MEAGCSGLWPLEKAAEIYCLGTWEMCSLCYAPPGVFHPPATPGPPGVVPAHGWLGAPARRLSVPGKEDALAMAPPSCPESLLSHSTSLPSLIAHKWLLLEPAAEQSMDQAVGMLRQRHWQELLESGWARCSVLESCGVPTGRPSASQAGAVFDPSCRLPSLN